MNEFGKYAGLDTHEDTIAVAVGKACGSKPRNWGNRQCLGGGGTTVNLGVTMMMMFSARERAVLVKCLALMVLPFRWRPT